MTDFRSMPGATLKRAKRIIAEAAYEAAAVVHVEGQDGLANAIALLRLVADEFEDEFELIDDEESPFPGFDPTYRVHCERCDGSGFDPLHRNEPCQSCLGVGRRVLGTDDNAGPELVLLP